MERNRIFYLVLIFLTVVAGLASRHFSAFLPSWINLYLGDMLWAMMVFFISGFVFRTKSILWIAVFALAFSFAIEVSQLYHEPWIDSLRATKLGGLILGFGFLWSDLACYSVGILLGSLFEFSFLKNQKGHLNNRGATLTPNSE